jgi:purine-binding chemotaxis protein CheW
MSNQFEISVSSHDKGIFAIRGELDGEEQREFVDAQQFIGLVIAKEEFMLPIEKVSEIIMIGNITYVPQGPKHVEGVINLRGQIIPAISLRSLMDHPIADPTPSSRIIIARFEELQIGLLVDAITYVVAVPKTNIVSNALARQGTRSELISEIAKRGDTLNGILDITKVIHTVNGGKPLDQESGEEEAAS